VRKRSYALSRYPAVVVLGAGKDDHESVDAFERYVAQALGVELHVSAGRDCLFIPAPYEVTRNGCVLTDEEHQAYDAASLAAAEIVGATSVRYFTDQLYALAWESFDRAADGALDAALATLPGWRGFDHGRPRWFGADEEVGPSLYGSIEPPGLQVSGVLELDTLRRWHRAFLRATRALPYSSP
jgi:hypothetical protein